MSRYTRRRALSSIAGASAAALGLGLGVTGSAAAAPPEASVSFPDQTRGRGAGGAKVRVEEATLDDGGFIVIHNDLLFETDPDDSKKENFRKVVDSISGVSDYLTPGRSKNVIISLRPDHVEDGEQTLIAMAHRDTNKNAEYDFEDQFPPAADLPYWKDPDNPGPGFAGGSGAVVDQATVRLVGGNGNGNGNGNGKGR
ncbi:MAG: hypothetical protein ABEH80_00485 [Halobaculum sp.]